MCGWSPGADALPYRYGMIGSWWPLLVLGGELLLKALMILVVLLQRGKAPSVRLAWIVLFVAVPFLGSLAFILVGTTRLGRLRRRRHREILATIPPGLVAHAPDAAHLHVLVKAEHRSIAHIAEAVGAGVPIGGNHATLFNDADAVVDALVSDIAEAREHCHLLYYIVLDDHCGRRVVEALCDAARRGVACRLLADAVGSRAFLRSARRGALREAGVHVVEALPANLLRATLSRLDLRNHRKIAVIDGRIGYVGSHNLADADFASRPSFAPLVDATVRLDGPVVHDLQALFVEDWFMDSDESLVSLLGNIDGIHDDGIAAQVMATGPNFRNQALQQLLQTAFHAAREELVLTTPYFAPDAVTETALCTAAQRGVETHLVLPARNDSRLVAAASRSRYRRMLEMGVRLHEYEGGLLHAKTMTIDREVALIGSANLDRRSLELNFEVSLLLFDTDFASQVRFLQTRYMEGSRRVDASVPLSWSIPRRAWQNAVALVGPLL